MIVIDGNDGIGKSTLCDTLHKRGYKVVDRGLPTKMTDKPHLAPGPKNEDEIYCILDAPVEVSRERLAAAGKDLTEHWHTVETLTHYRKRFQEVANFLNVPVIDASGTREQTLDKVLKYLDIKATFRVGIPKGRLNGAATEWMLRAGFPLEVTGRSYHPKSPGIDPYILKPRSLPQMVALGMLDAAITGSDLVQECINSPALSVRAQLTSPSVRLCVASRSEEILKGPLSRPLVVATEFPYIASRWMTQKGIAHIIIQTYGSTEAYAPTFAEVVVDVVESGQTLRDNGLTILSELMTCSPVLITRRGSAAMHHQFVRRMWETIR